MTEDAVPDVFALIEETREEPVGHLENQMTARDEADLELRYAAGAPQHARPSRRSADMLGRVLVALVVLGVVAVAVIVTGEVVGGWDLPRMVAAWALVVPGVVVMLAAAGCAALAAFERWYERRRPTGGGSP